MSLYFLLYFILFPVSVLIHELGHALGTILFSERNAKIYLGKNRGKSINFKLGRIEFCLRWSIFGFCKWLGETAFTKKQHIIALASGPIMTLLFIIILLISTIYIPDNPIKYVLYNTITFNALLFIFAILPTNYFFSDMPSDGRQILHQLKNKKSA